jgi:hypothetical protein
MSPLTGASKMSIPKLEHHCGSWIIVDRQTGNSVLETFSHKIAEAVNQDKYEVLTALQYLCRLNSRI